MVGEFGGLGGYHVNEPSNLSDGSISHQSVVIQAVIQAMKQQAAHGVTGGTVWLLEQNEGKGYPCTPWDFICFGMSPTPALNVLAAAAVADDHQ